jgi:hypothetical protein
MVSPAIAGNVSSRRDARAAARCWRMVAPKVAPNDTRIEG